MNISVGQTWQLYGSETTVYILRIEDWVNRNDPNDKGTRVTYMFSNAALRGVKTKSLEDFIQNYKLLP